MSERGTDGAAPAGVRLDFRGGGWVLLLAGLLVAGLVVWRLVAVAPGLGQRAPGAAGTLESYGFNLEVCLVPRELLVPANMVKDGLRALVEPETISAAEMDARRLGRGPFLTSHDRVIGVAINGEARAYPLRIMIWHEIANDTIAGHPVAVTYNPLCDAALVLDRRLGEEVLEFGVSGLVFNSNLVLYDRRAAPREESLWSQLQHRAIAGPAAVRGERLEPLPSAVMGWKAWRELHPQTRVLAPDRSLMRRYRQEAYSTYFADRRLMFPVAPLPASPDTYKQPCAGVLVGGEWHVWQTSDLLARATVEFKVDETAVRVNQWIDPVAVQFEDSAGRPLPSATGFRFAWHSMYGEAIFAP